MLRGLILTVMMGFAACAHAAFPANQDQQARGLSNAQATAKNLKTHATNLRAQMAAGNIEADQIVDLYRYLIQTKDRLNAVAAIPGIAQYAKDQFNNQSLDIVAEFNAMVTEIQDTIDLIVSIFPKDGNGYLLKDKLIATGIDNRDFTPAQTATLRTQLDALIATIE